VLRLRVHDPHRAGGECGHTGLYILNPYIRNHQILVSVERYLAVLRPLLVGALLSASRLCALTIAMYSLCILTNIPYLYQTRYMYFEADNHTTIHSCTKWDSNPDLFYMNHSLMNTINFVVW
jgi:hypothetical protein